MTKPTSSWAVGVLVAFAAIGALGVGATASVRSAHEICSPCGTFQVTTHVLRVFETNELEETEDSRWLLAHDAGDHVHTWVFSHTTWWGWISNGIGCALPEEESHVYALWDAHDRLGDDPELASLATEFVSLDPSDTQRRGELAELASRLDSSS